MHQIEIKNSLAIKALSLRYLVNYWFEKETCKMSTQLEQKQKINGWIKDKIFWDNYGSVKNKRD